MKKYEEIVENIKKNIPQMIRQGIQKLPSEPEACERYGVSRQTVRKAYSVLEDEQLIHSVHGSGTFLTGLLPDQNANQVVLLLTTDTEYIYPELLGSLGRQFSEHGFSFSVYTTGSSIQRERDILQELLSRHPRGLIAEGCHNALPSPNLDLYQKLEASGTSILFLFGSYPNAVSPLEVKDANFQGGYDLTAYLLGRGHRHIAGIFQNDTVQGLERYHGYVSALSAHQAELPSDNVLWFHNYQLSELQTKQDTRFLREFVRSRLVSSTAVVCHNDEIAYWLIRELRRAGLRVPQDLSVAGFDNSYLRYVSDLHLTTLTHEEGSLSETISSTLLRRMSGSFTSSSELPWILLEGNSVRDL